MGNEQIVDKFGMTSDQQKIIDDVSNKLHTGIPITPEEETLFMRGLKERTDNFIKRLQEQAN